MNDLPLVEQFITYLEVERNFSEHTVRSYRADLTQFCLFMTALAQASLGLDTLKSEDLPGEDALDVSQLTQALPAVTPTEIRAFLAMMRNSEYSKATIARKLASLRSFYKYLARTGTVATSPVALYMT